MLHLLAFFGLHFHLLHRLVGALSSQGGAGGGVGAGGGPGVGAGGDGGDGPGGAAVVAVVTCSRHH